jgi:N-acetylglucosaminyldiphosphoundecaprenol N-acetyl-beta-D-mannosaminyltransferase
MKVDCMGFKVYNDSIDNIEIKNGPKIINTISPNSYGISVKDRLFRKALKESDYLVLDGVYFGLSSMILNGKVIKKNQGPEVYFRLMQRLKTSGGKVFFLGSNVETLEKIKNKAKNEYPNIQVAYYSPPYKHEFSEDDDKCMISAINEFNPDILFIGMTCPKQEKWAFKNKMNVKADIIACIGAVFDWYAGNEKQIAAIWWRLNMAWLIRTINRPEILKRYPNIAIFFMHLFYAIIGIKKYRYGNF